LRIFLSHSSADKTLTEGLQEELLRQAPADLGVEILVDLTTLRPGLAWPLQLHEMMACCHAAVLLLTKSALNSDWVLKEATILAWRAALDRRRFKLFVVQMRDVAEADLRAAKFDPLMLGDLERIVADTPGDIARSVIDNLPRIPGFQASLDPGIPLDSIIMNLSALLKRVDENILAQIRPKLALPAPMWRPSDYCQFPDAVLIARQLLRGELGTYQGVEELIAELARATSTEVVRGIFREIAPYWVPAQDAGRLPALRTESGKGSAALIGRLVGEYSADMYVRRAHAGSLLVATIPIPGNNAGDLKLHITSRLCEWYRNENGVELEDHEVIDLINSAVGKFWYVVVVLPVLPPDDVIKALMETFQTLRFIFGLKQKPTDEETGSDRNWDRLEIDPTTELRQWLSRSDVNRMLQRLSSI
jgi:TIR domain